MADLASLRVPISADLGPLKAGMADARKTAETGGAAIGSAYSTAAQRAEREWAKLQKQMGGAGFRSANDNIDRLAKGLDHLGDEAGQTARQLTLVERASHGAGTGLSAASRGMLGLAAAVGGSIGLAEVATQFIRMSDEATKLEGRLALVTRSSSDLARVQSELFRVSQETRSAFGSNVELFARAAQATSSLGTSQADLIKLTTVLNQGFVISGATAEEASNAIIQLSQGLSSGALRGEEFNSVNEGGARITRALADSLGVTVGKLRELAGEGKLTTDIVVRGLLSQAGVLNDEFAKVPRTVGDAMTQVRNSLLRAVDGLNEASGATSGVVTQIDRLRTLIDSPAFQGAAASVFASIGNDLRTLNDIFEDITAVQAWAGTIETEAGKAREAIGGAASSLYDTWRTNYDANLALIAPWVEAWSAGALKVQTANEAAATNSGLSWSSFVSNSLDEIATIIAASKALGGIGSEAGIAGTFQSEFAAAREMLEGYVTTARQGVSVVLDEVVISEETAAQARRAHIEAIKDSDLAVEGLTRTTVAAAAPLAGAIEGGITKPSKEAAKALRDAEQARKALFSEADAAVERFFPMQAAEAEATRLRALIDDTGNGLTDLQRRALGLKLNQGFIDAMEPAGGFRDRVRRVGDEFERVGDIGQDVFGGVLDSLMQGGDLVDNLISSFANLGQQLATAGLDRLLGGLFGGQKSSGTSNVASIIPAIAANSNIPSPTARPTYYAPSYPYSDKYAVPAVTAATQKMTTANSSLAEVITDGARRLGTTARDLATVISYETGGTFSTSIRGGTNDQHIGLIQFGQTEQKRYGDAIGQTLSDQMDAVVGYLQDRGFQPGMGLLDLYSTINAGRPGRYGASDARNGGAPGTVYDKVSNQMAGHMAKADSILGGTRRDLTRGVADGVEDGIKGLSNDPWVTGDGMNLRATGSTAGGVTRGQAGLGTALGLFGIAANGAQSGSPIMGGLSGAMGGFELGTTLGIGGPAGMALGAAAGCIAGKIGRKHRRAA